MRTRRAFFGLVGGMALVPIVGAGCVESAYDVGPDGAIEILPRTPGLYYGNVLPDHAPAVRQSPALDARSITKH